MHIVHDTPQHKGVLDGRWVSSTGEVYCIQGPDATCERTMRDLPVAWTRGGTFLIGGASAVLVESGRMVFEDCRVWVRLQSPHPAVQGDAYGSDEESVSGYDSHLSSSLSNASPHRPKREGSVFCEERKQARKVSGLDLDSHREALKAMEREEMYQSSPLRRRGSERAVGVTPQTSSSVLEVTRMTTTTTTTTTGWHAARTSSSLSLSPRNDKIVYPDPKQLGADPHYDPRTVSNGYALESQHKMEFTENRFTSPRTEKKVQEALSKGQLERMEKEKREEKEVHTASPPPRRGSITGVGCVSEGLTQESPFRTVRKPVTPKGSPKASPVSTWKAPAPLDLAVVMPETVANSAVGDPFSTLEGEVMRALEKEGLHVASEASPARSARFPHEGGVGEDGAPVSPLSMSMSMSRTMESGAGGDLIRVASFGSADAKRETEREDQVEEVYQMPSKPRSV